MRNDPRRCGSDPHTPCPNPAVYRASLNRCYWSQRGFIGTLEVLLSFFNGCEQLLHFLSARKQVSPQHRCIGLWHSQPLTDCVSCRRVAVQETAVANIILSRFIWMWRLVDVTIRARFHRAKCSFYVLLAGRTRKGKVTGHRFMIYSIKATNRKVFYIFTLSIFSGERAPENEQSSDNKVSQHITFWIFVFHKKSTVLPPEMCISTVSVTLPCRVMLIQHRWLFMPNESFSDFLAAQWGCNIRHHWPQWCQSFSETHRDRWPGLRHRCFSSRTWTWTRVHVCRWMHRWLCVYGLKFARNVFMYSNCAFVVVMSGILFPVCLD